MKNLINKLLVSLSNNIDNILTYLFGAKCEKCQYRALRHGYYTSGWNNYCQQASGDRGVICENCLHVKFDKTLEERKKIAKKYSPWVDVKC